MGKVIMAYDAGAETSSNYRFQHIYAALLAIQMYNQKNNFVAIICEVGNDIIAKDKHGYLTAYQVTRINDLSISKDKINQSIKRFIEQNKRQKFKAFCLISNQKIGTIATTVNKMYYLSPSQISKYSCELFIDMKDIQSKECFEKMTFMIVNDILGLESLIGKEIVYSLPQISYNTIKSIEQELINLAQRCSRSAEKEDSRFYTSIDKAQRHLAKIESRTITPIDVRNIITDCQGKIEENEHKVVRPESLKENDEQVLTQFVAEASDKDEKIASTALISLEHIGREMKIYKSRRLKEFLRKSLNDNSKIRYFDYYFDLIRRLLYQSTIQRDNGFLNYIKKYLKRNIIESATSLEPRYDRCRTNAMQTIDDYDIVASDKKKKLYVQTLIEFVKHCEDEMRYSEHLQYLTFRLPNNTANRALIRSKLIAIKKDSSSPENTKRRCDNLLGEYK